MIILSQQINLLLPLSEKSYLMHSPYILFLHFTKKCLWVVVRVFPGFLLHQSLKFHLDSAPLCVLRQSNNHTLTFFHFAFYIVILCHTHQHVLSLTHGPYFIRWPCLLSSCLLHWNLFLSLKVCILDPTKQFFKTLNICPLCLEIYT